MISNLKIKNFKSIKSLNLDCRKVNVFIGPPNVGKSNLLEGIGLFCMPCFGLSQFGQIIRFSNFADLFHDSEVAEGIRIIAGIHEFCIDSRKDNFIGAYKDHLEFTANSAGIVSIDKRFKAENIFRYYKFRALSKFSKKEPNFLVPPEGDNLLFLLQIDKSLRRLAADLFSSQGFKIVLKPQEDKIEIQKEIEDLIVAYPYSAASDTLQRFIFHLAAVETNRNSVIILEEPESHAFPYYTKLLAERIALDEGGNQYFISTHNPYFLFPLISKAPKEQLAVFVTSLENYETQAHPLSQAGIEKALSLDADAFFNFDKLLDAR